jgi:hypothetical protein
MLQCKRQQSPDSGRGLWALKTSKLGQEMTFAYWQHPIYGCYPQFWYSY